LKFSRLNQALAIANLANLGFVEHEAFAISRTWAERQFLQSVEKVEITVAGANVNDLLPKGVDGHRMFASFHYSIYPLIYRSLAECSDKSVVNSLIGQQSERHRVELNRLAATLNFQVNFIESSIKMARQLKNAIRHGAAGILLVDIPWSQNSSELDVTYPVTGGRFRGRSSLERLINLVDEEYQFVTAFGSLDNVTLSSHGSLRLAEAFSWLGHALQSAPADYERLHQFHRFFEFDSPRNCVITFEIQGDRFALHSRTMKAWQITRSSDAFPHSGSVVCDDTTLVNKFKRIVNDDVESVVFL
jgi:hypothetical protein